MESNKIEISEVQESEIDWIMPSKKNVAKIVEISEYMTELHDTGKFVKRLQKGDGDIFIFPIKNKLYFLNSSNIHLVIQQVNNFIKFRKNLKKIVFLY